MKSPRGLADAYEQMREDEMRKDALGDPAITPSGSPLQSSEDGRISAAIDQEPAHTPLPWLVGISTIAAVKSPIDGGDVICDAPEWADASMVKWPVNAAFIVRACNSHYELIELLKGISAACHDSDDTIQLTARVMSRMVEIDAAIAKATQP